MLRCSSVAAASAAKSLSAWRSERARKERERPLQRERRGLRLEILALVAIEAVPRRINMVLGVWIGLLEAQHVLGWNDGVASAEVEQQRRARALVPKGDRTAAVGAHRRQLEPGVGEQ